MNREIRDKQKGIGEKDGRMIQRSGKKCMSGLYQSAQFENIPSFMNTYEKGSHQEMDCQSEDQNRNLEERMSKSGIFFRNGRAVVSLHEFGNERTCSEDEEKIRQLEERVTQLNRHLREVQAKLEKDLAIQNQKLEFSEFELKEYKQKLKDSEDFFRLFPVDDQRYQQHPLFKQKCQQMAEIHNQQLTLKQKEIDHLKNKLNIQTDQLLDQVSQINEKQDIPCKYDNEDDEREDLLLWQDRQREFESKLIEGTELVNRLRDEIDSKDQLIIEYEEQCAQLREANQNQIYILQEQMNAMMQEREAQIQECFEQQYLSKLEYYEIKHSEILEDNQKNGDEQIRIQQLSFEQQMQIKEEEIREQMIFKEEGLLNEMQTKEKQLKEEMQTKENELKGEMLTKEKFFKEEMQTREKELKEEMQIKEKELREELEAYQKEKEIHSKLFEERYRALESSFQMKELQFQEDMRRKEELHLNEMRVEKEKLEEEMKNEKLQLQDEMRAEKEQLEDEMRTEKESLQEEMRMNEEQMRMNEEQIRLIFLDEIRKKDEFFMESLRIKESEIVYQTEQKFLQEMNSQLSEKDAELSSYLRILEQQQQEIKSLTNKLHVSEQQIGNAHSVSSASVEQGKQMDSLNEQTIMQEKENVQIKQQNLELENQINSQEEHIFELQQASYVMEQQLSSLEQHNNSLQQQINLFQQEKDNFENERIFLDKMVSQLRNENEQMRQQELKFDQQNINPKTEHDTDINEYIMRTEKLQLQLSQQNEVISACKENAEILHLENRHLQDQLDKAIILSNEKHKQHMEQSEFQEIQEEEYENRLEQMQNILDEKEQLHVAELHQKDILIQELIQKINSFDEEIMLQISNPYLNLKEEENEEIISENKDIVEDEEIILENKDFQDIVEDEEIISENKDFEDIVEDDGILNDEEEFETWKQNNIDQFQDNIERIQPSEEFEQVKRNRHQQNSQPPIDQNNLNQFNSLIEDNTQVNHQNDQNPIENQCQSIIPNGQVNSLSHPNKFINQQKKVSNIINQNNQNHQVNNQNNFNPQVNNQNNLNHQVNNQNNLNHQVNNLNHQVNNQNNLNYQVNNQNNFNPQVNNQNNLNHQVNNQNNLIYQFRNGKNLPLKQSNNQINSQVWTPSPPLPPLPQHLQNNLIKTQMQTPHVPQSYLTRQNAVTPTQSRNELERSFSPNIECQSSRGKDSRTTHSQKRNIPLTSASQYCSLTNSHQNSNISRQYNANHNGNSVLSHGMSSLGLPGITSGMTGAQMLEIVEKVYTQRLKDQQEYYEWKIMSERENMAKLWRDKRSMLQGKEIVSKELQCQRAQKLAEERETPLLNQTDLVRRHIKENDSFNSSEQFSCNRSDNQSSRTQKRPNIQRTNKMIVNPSSIMSTNINMHCPSDSSDNSFCNKKQANCMIKNSDSQSVLNWYSPTKQIKRSFINIGDEHSEAISQSRPSSGSKSHINLRYVKSQSFHNKNHQTNKNNIFPTPNSSDKDNFPNNSHIDINNMFGSKNTINQQKQITNIAKKQIFNSKFDINKLFGNSNNIPLSPNNPIEHPHLVSSQPKERHIPSSNNNSLFEPFIMTDKSNVFGNSDANHFSLSSKKAQKINICASLGCAVRDQNPVPSSYIGDTNKPIIPEASKTSAPTKKFSSFLNKTQIN